MMNYKPGITKKQSSRIVQRYLKTEQPGNKIVQKSETDVDLVMQNSKSDMLNMQPIEQEEELLQPKLRMQPMEEKEELIQPKTDSVSGFASHHISGQLQNSKGSGNPLPTSVNQFMSNALSADFSGVNIHTDNRAVSLNESLNSRAFTHGSDIFFNKDEYNPDSLKGKRLLAHELTHTVQQGFAGKVQNKINNSTSVTDTISADANSGIQRLIKPNHPWTGTVVDTPLLALRDAPGGNTLADLPDNTLVNVVSNSGGWLNLEVDTSQAGVILNRMGRSQLAGNTLDGYSYHRYIDDAAAAEMSEMVGEQARWVPSGPSSGNTFQTWASASSESAAPPITSVTTINCWEMVLMAAFRIGAIDWQWIHDLYTNSVGNWYDELPNRMTRGGTTTYDLASHTPLPVRGDIVFFDGASHVALATGNADEILTFWPPPNTAFTAGGTVDDVKLSTIEILSDWMTANLSTPTVTFGSPAW